MQALRVDLDGNFEKVEAELRHKLNRGELQDFEQKVVDTLKPLFADQFKDQLDSKADKSDVEQIQKFNFGLWFTKLQKDL